MNRGTNWQSAYCTNVHSGADFALTQRNLAVYASRVRDLLEVSELGIGLWLSASAAAVLAATPEKTDEFSTFLQQEGLIPFTLNGFPYGDFHQPIVKHKVYHPTWFEASRFEYTCQLAKLLDLLAPVGRAGSISTLPIAWRSPTPDDALWGIGVDYLRRLANYLAELEAERGRLIFLCIEPEPGCLLQTSSDLVAFYQDHLLGPSGTVRVDEARIRRHIRICHDVCHAVVMCESQRDVLEHYRRAGIQVGKVQISSAVVVPLDALELPERVIALEQLSSFAEDRYLHQTTVSYPNQPPRYFDDLPEALAASAGQAPSGTWRVHFHIPVYLEQFGLLRGSQQDILECLDGCRELSDVSHFEVETYAWNVLPESLRRDDLAAGIADEMRWFWAQVTEGT